MSNFSGPGVYMVIPTNAKEMCLDVWGGGSNPGAPVRLDYNGMDRENQIWEVVAAGGDRGCPEVGVQDRQYHLLAVNSGLMLCAPVEGEMTGCVVATRSVRDPSTRWKISPAGNEAYYITSMAGTNLALSVQAGRRGRGEDLVVSPKVAQPYFQFELKTPPF
ncbi:hypothetical protein FRB94_004687 [Tulasnella sp. JGI-2019a]|nr:hypothetical protein FRB94_004687 [Tulasnella sp. JGI-2019a]